MKYSHCKTSNRDVGLNGCRNPIGHDGRFSGTPEKKKECSISGPAQLREGDEQREQESPRYIAPGTDCSPGFDVVSVAQI